MTDKVIDETTIVRFRTRLREHALLQGLFDEVVACLIQKGLIVEEGTLAAPGGATIIQAPRGKAKDAPGRGLDTTRQKAATYTRKHGRTYFRGHGDKPHIATDPNGMVKDYVYDTAKVHDSQHMDQLIEGETQEVFADSAYMDKARKARLQDQGVFCGIIQRPPVRCVAGAS